MENRIIGLCPVCFEKLKITKLECDKCGTGITGEFHLSKFDYLTKEHQNFVEIFLKNRGNIKEIEKELGISYPTVRKFLDEVIISLGYKVSEEEKSKVSKKEILEKLSNGKITLEESLKLLKKC